MDFATANVETSANGPVGPAPASRGRASAYRLAWQFPDWAYVIYRLLGRAMAKSPKIR